MWLSYLISLWLQSLFSWNIELSIDLFKSRKSENYFKPTDSRWNFIKQDSDSWIKWDAMIMHCHAKCHTTLINTYSSAYTDSWLSCGWNSKNHPSLINTLLMSPSVLTASCMMKLDVIREETTYFVTVIILTWENELHFYATRLLEKMSLVFLR